MATTLVSPQEYLRTGYNPDVEYVDGALVERSMPNVNHAGVETATASYFFGHQKEWDIRALTNARLMVGPTKYRIPDISVVERPFPKGPAITEAPAVIIEILSPEDDFKDVMTHCREYEALGTRNIIVLDPDEKRLYLFRAGSLILADGDRIDITLPKSGREVSLPIDAPFADLE